MKRRWVFVRHRTSDLATATSLAEEFRKLRYRSWLGGWQAEGGESIPGGTNAALETAQLVAICCLLVGPDSWMGAKACSAFPRQLAAPCVGLLPVLRLQVQIPPRFGSVEYAGLWDTYIAVHAQARQCS
jgi:hypothetical protein